MTLPAWLKKTENKRNKYFIELSLVLKIVYMRCIIIIYLFIPDLTDVGRVRESESRLQHTKRMILNAVKVWTLLWQSICKNVVLCFLNFLDSCSPMNPGVVILNMPVLSWEKKKNRVQLMEKPGHSLFSGSQLTLFPEDLKLMNVDLIS